MVTSGPMPSPEWLRFDNSFRLLDAVDQTACPDDIQDKRWEGFRLIGGSLSFVENGAGIKVHGNQVASLDGFRCLGAF